VPVDESLNVSFLGWLVDQIRNIDRKEIAGFEESIDRFQVYVIGINIILVLPAELTDSSIGRGARGGRFGADDRMLPVRLIPDWGYVDASVLSKNTGAKLRIRLSREAIPYANRILRESNRIRHLTIIGADGKDLSSTALRAPESKSDHILAALLRIVVANQAKSQTKVTTDLAGMGIAASARRLG